MSWLSKAIGGGGVNIPSLDTKKLLGIAEGSAQKQRQLIGERLAGLQPITSEFKTQRQALSERIPRESEQLIGKYGQELSGVGTAESAARDAANAQFRTQAFRDVPAIQQAIRNQLGGSRLMGSGAALSSLAKPTIQAAQSASDFAAENERQRLANLTGRAENLASTGFNTRQQAQAERLGIDQGTIDALTQMGRTDLIDKFNSLAGVESELGGQQLAIEQAKQANDIARAQAEAQKRAGMGGFLGSALGMGAGFLAGGPLGAAIGGQLGGSLGTAAGGGVPGQLDPTLLFALSQQKKQAFQNRLGSANTSGFGTVGTYSPTRSQMGY